MGFGNQLWTLAPFGLLEKLTRQQRFLRDQGEALTKKLDNSANKYSSLGFKDVTKYREMMHVIY